MSKCRYVDNAKIGVKSRSRAKGTEASKSAAQANACTLYIHMSSVKLLPR